MDFRLAILGLGYVGEPLAKAFAVHFPVVGIDVDSAHIQRLKDTKDDLLRNQLQEGRLVLRNELRREDGANVYIISVPTPVDDFHIPDLSALRSASTMVGNVLKKGDVVVYESTVYPGCTEEVCIPVLEKCSGLKLNQDFGVGYSPERINPGDKVHTLETIDKIVSGSDETTLAIVEKLYSTILTATVHPVSSIKIAEAAKVIENAQRDVNISFMNELAFIFDRMNIDTNEVIDAASSKWNFLPFRPGLVGGHCIGVDPYYLTYKSQQLGYSPEVILSGRRVNNTMPLFIVNKIVKLLVQKNKPIKGAKVLILGFAFKENCGDFRNTRVADMYKEFVEFGASVDIVDPWVDRDAVQKIYQIEIAPSPQKNIQYDVIVLAVAHDIFRDFDAANCINGGNTVVFDTKNFFPKKLVTGRL